MRTWNMFSFFYVVHLCSEDHDVVILTRLGRGQNWALTMPVLKKTNPARTDNYQPTESLWQFVTLINDACISCVMCCLVGIFVLKKDAIMMYKYLSRLTSWWPLRWTITEIPYFFRVKYAFHPCTLCVVPAICAWWWFSKLSYHWFRWWYTFFGHLCFWGPPSCCALHF